MQENKHNEFDTVVEMETRKIIGQRINAALARGNCKQKDLAKALGVTDNTISYFVSGARTPNTEQIIKIAQFLNVSADYLLGISNAPSVDLDTQALCKKIGCSEEALEGILYFFVNDYPGSYMNLFADSIFSAPDSHCPPISSFVFFRNHLFNYIVKALAENGFAEGIANYKGDKKSKPFREALKKHSYYSDKKDMYEWQLIKYVIRFADIIKAEFTSKIGQAPYFDDFMEQELAKEEAIRKPDIGDE